MEKKHTSERMKKNVLKVAGVASTAAYLFMPSSAPAFNPGAVVNKTPVEAREVTPGHLEEHFDEYNVFASRKDNNAYIVADIKDGIRAYIEDGDLITSTEFKELKKELGIKYVSLKYQVHAKRGFVKGENDYVLAFMADLTAASDRAKGDLAKKVSASSRFNAGEKSVGFDKKIGRGPISVNKKLNRGFGYGIYWNSHVGFCGGESPGAGSVGGSVGGGVGGGAGGIGGAGGNGGGGIK